MTLSNPESVAFVELIGATFKYGSLCKLILNVHNKLLKSKTTFVFRDIIRQVTRKSFWTRSQHKNLEDRQFVPPGYVGDPYELFATSKPMQKPNLVQASGTENQIPTNYAPLYL